MLQSDPAQMGDILQQRYRKAFSIPNNVDIDNIELHQQTTQTLKDIPLTLDDVLGSIKYTGSHSVPGFLLCFSMSVRTHYPSPSFISGDNP